VGAKPLCGAVAILIVGAGVAVSTAAYAETAAVEREASDRAGSQSSASTPSAQGVESRRERSEPAYQRREKWWIRARAVLFSDIQLSPAQSRGVDEIFETQLADLRRSGELKAELRAAQRQADAERTAAIRREIGVLFARLKNPHECIEAMRAFLSDEQRPTFDMNRARLFAEDRSTGNKRRRRNPGANAAPSRLE
jgi:hypothetical protein